MKKKLRKELSKLLPDNEKCIKVSDEIIPLPGNKWTLSFYSKKKEVKPEYIRVTYLEWGAEDVVANGVYEVDKWDRGRPIIIDDVGLARGLTTFDWKPATKADYEAHKLGFHVGDEVWRKDTKNNNPKIIAGIHYGGTALYCTFKNKASWDYLKDLTKTPPKKTIFQIDGKDKFEGDEIWFLNKFVNWKLSLKKVYDFEYEKGADNYECFNTKQQALDYVLTEAKERFKDDKFNRINTFSFNCFDRLVDGEKCIWEPKKGWTAESIKQPENEIYPLCKDQPAQIECRVDSCKYHQDAKCVNPSPAITLVSKSFTCWSKDEETPLMLGNEVVEILKDYKDHRYGQYHDFIKCKGESVTKKEWMVWYEKFSKVYPLVQEAGIYLGEYNKYGSYINKSETSRITIGCIKGVTIEQIEQITKKLNELK